MVSSGNSLRIAKAISCVPVWAGSQIAARHGEPAHLMRSWLIVDIMAGFAFGCILLATQQF